MTASAADYIARFQLQPHPEGGYFRETYRSTETVSARALPSRFAGNRALGTAIVFLLPSAQISCFHRIRADEIWHFYAGSPLTLHILDHDGSYRHLLLGPDIHSGHFPQTVVLHDTWFAASVAAPDAFSLTGCTTAPGFDFEDFEMASRQDLLARFPRHADLVRRLTPDPAPPD